MRSVQGRKCVINVFMYLIAPDGCHMSRRGCKQPYEPTKHVSFFCNKKRRAGEESSEREEGGGGHTKKVLKFGCRELE